MKNKTRNLIGRFTALLIILVLSLSVFSCAKVPTEDGAIVDNLKIDVDVPPENNEKTELPEQPKDKAEPCGVTIDEPFSDFEVVVSFTLEESAKDLEYFPEDFPEVDCFNVYLFDYYPEEVHPEYKDRKTVILMLNEQSKQGVLDAVKILEKDDRVYSAEPNYYGAVIGEKNYFYISTNKYLYEYEESGTLENLNDAFDIDGVEKVSTLQMQEYKRFNFNINDCIYKISCNNFDIEILKAFSKDYRINYIISPIESLASFENFYVIMKEENEYTFEDFSYIEHIKDFKLKWTNINIYEVTLQCNNYHNLVSVYFAFKNDDRVKSIDIMHTEYGYVLP